MIERALENPQVASALVSLLVGLLGSVGALIFWVLRRYIPQKVDARLQFKLQEIELRQSEIDARAMRDRAIADAINHAAGTNAQALEVIRIQAHIIQHAGREEGYVKDELSRINLMLHQSNHHLKFIKEKMETNNNGNSEDESVTTGTAYRGDGSRGDSADDARPEG